MLICDFYRSRFAKIDAGAGSHDGNIVEEIMDCNGIGGGVEGSNDSAKGFQWGEGVEGRIVGNQGADFKEGGWVKD